LTGAIGSGKSTVARMLGEMGGLVVDADANAKEALELPEVRQQLIDWWGPGVLDERGQPDRGAIARIVFNDPHQRRRLEGLIHPIVRAKQTRLIERAREDPSVAFVVLDVPLLVEVGSHELCDHLLYVDADRETRLRRVAQNRGWTEKELNQREKNQAPLDKKLKFAHHIIDNNSSEVDCRAQVRSFLASIQSSS
jgi:dephospho-CoA kinase